MTVIRNDNGIDWGSFESGRDGNTHVCPLSKDNRPRPPHILSMRCSCIPTADADDPNLIIHNMEH